MLTGTVPFKGDSAVTVALKHVNEMAPEPAQLVPGLPYSLNQIVLKAIAKDPDLRYQTAGQFARDLRSAAEGGPVAAAAFDSSAEATRLMGAGVAGAAAGAAAGATSMMAPGAYGTERRPPRRRWPWIVVIVILLLVIAAAAYGLIRVMGGGGGEPVPSVVGKTQSVAVSTLEQAGFKASVQEEFSDKYDKGVVSRQAPTGGTELAKGETVDLWVSKGSETLALEDFTGWSPQEVQDYLKQNGLSGLQKSGKTSAVPQGQVYKQEPAAGTDVRRGDVVTYWVCSGEPQVAVPVLTGLTQADAQQALTDAKLTLGSVDQETSTSVPAGQVIRQDPVAGTKVAKGAAVNIVISSGTPTPTATPTPSPTVSGVEVPNVYGMDSTTATSQLNADGFGVVIKQRPGTGQPQGTVVKMVPDAGTVVAEGSTVVLTIAK
jgi:beta-lactam-binding protein with PASTA domain